MRAFSIILVLFSMALPALTAPTKKVDELTPKEIRNELKQFGSQLSSLSDELGELLGKIDNGHQKKSENHENSERFKKEEKEKENDDFIARIAITVASHLSPNDPARFIEGLVNSTTAHLVAKMKASHGGVYDFQNKLLAKVIQILNKRSETYEKSTNKSLLAGPSGVDENKVVQALEELLEGPLIRGFVSKEQEKLMIKSAITSLSDVFGQSTSRMNDIIRTMKEHVEKDVESLTQKNMTAMKPMNDGQKILGLQKMLIDKVKEKLLNLEEMKYLVKGLIAAVGARNKLSSEKTKQLEQIVYREVKKYFEENKIPVNATSTSEDSQLIYNKDVPEGFRKAKEEKTKNDKRSSVLFMPGGTYNTVSVFKQQSFDVEGNGSKDEEFSKGGVFAQLRALEKKLEEQEKLKKNTDVGKRSFTDAIQQGDYLKAIIKNSISLIESLTAKPKDIGPKKSKVDKESSKNSSAVEEKPAKSPVGKKSFITDLEKGIEEAEAKIEKALPKNLLKAKKEKKENEEKENEEKENEKKENQKRSSVLVMPGGTYKPVSIYKQQYFDFERDNYSKNKIFSKGGVFKSLKELKKKWQELEELKKDKENNKRSFTNATKQREYLMAIITNSIALIETLASMPKDLKPTRASTIDEEPTENNTAVHEEPTKSAVEKKSFITDNLEKEIEKAEAKIQKEIEEKERDAEKKISQIEAKAEKTEKKTDKREETDEKEKEKEQKENEEEKVKEQKKNEEEKEKQPKIKEKEEKSNEEEKEKEEKEKEQKENKKEKGKEQKENDQEKEKEEKKKEEEKEKQEREKEKEVKEKEEEKENEQREKEDEKQKERKEKEREQKEQEGEKQQKEKVKINEDEINKVEKEIEKELEELKGFGSHEKSNTTNSEKNTQSKKKAEGDNELIKQLEDLFN